SYLSYRLYRPFRYWGWREIGRAFVALRDDQRKQTVCRQTSFTNVWGIGPDRVVEDRANRLRVPLIHCENASSHRIRMLLKVSDDAARFTVMLEKLNFGHLIDLRGRSNVRERHFPI